MFILVHASEDVADAGGLILDHGKNIRTRLGLILIASQAQDLYQHFTLTC